MLSAAPGEQYAYLYIFFYKASCPDGASNIDVIHIK